MEEDEEPEQDEEESESEVLEIVPSKTKTASRKQSPKAAKPKASKAKTRGEKMAKGKKSIWYHANHYPGREAYKKKWVREHYGKKSRKGGKGRGR